MYELLFLLPFIVFFGTAFFLDLVFKSCMLFPYIRFLHNTGLAIKPLAICWETTRLNRPFMKCGSIRPNLLRRWFQLGAFIVSLSVIPALCILFVPVFQYFTNDKSTPILMPIIPGLNLPYSQLLYYSLALFICVTFHEFGHALAASREKVPIEGFGINVLGIFPVAYVRISLEHIGQINVVQQLRIYSAGVWHNLVLAIFVFALVKANPYIFKPIYQQGRGVTVIDVKQGSGLGQKGGLMSDDTIIGVNECLVQTETDWEACIHEEYRLDVSGFCAYESFFKKEDISMQGIGNSECCPNSSNHMCFHIANNESLNNILKAGEDFSIQKNLGHLMCLPARKLAENAKMCWDERDCNENFCLLPVLGSKSERFLKITLSSKRTVFYVGQIEEIFSSVAVSRWVSDYVAVCYIDMYENLIGYIFSFSCGLAILNTIPFFWLDGKLIIQCIIHGYFNLCVSKVSHRRILVCALQVAGSAGLLLCFTISLLKYV